LGVEKPPAEVATASVEPDDVIEAELAAAIASEERRLYVERFRAKPLLVFASLTMLFLGAPLLDRTGALLGNATLGVTAPLAAALLLLKALAAVGARRLAFAGIAQSWIATLADLAPRGALLVVMFTTKTPSTALWALLLILPMTLRPRSGRDVRLLMFAVFALDVVMLAALLWAHRRGQAAFFVVVTLSSWFGLWVSLSLFVRGLQVRCERSVLARRLRVVKSEEERRRIARDLHDGVGADLAALLLQLRMSSSSLGHTTAARLESSVRQALQQIREVVWWLKRAEGTLEELGKLIDVRMRRRLGEATRVQRLRSRHRACALTAAASVAALAAFDAALKLPTFGASVQSTAIEMESSALVMRFETTPEFAPALLAAMQAPPAVAAQSGEASTLPTDDGAAVLLKLPGAMRH